MPMFLRCSIALVLSLGFLSCKCPKKAKLPESYTWEMPLPACGPMEGGTVVTITGKEFTHIDGLWAQQEGGKLELSYTKEDDVITITMPKSSEPGTVAITAHWEFPLKSKRTCSKQVVLGLFTYMDLELPMMFDADPIGAGVNPFEFEGNCGGYYWRRIDGRHFLDGEISVTWKGDRLTVPDQVRVLDDETLEVLVPPGPEGQWIRDIRVHKTPPECETELSSENIGSFRYEQGDCISMGAHGTLVTSGAGPQVVGVGELIADVDVNNDVAVAAKGVAGVPTLEAFKGDGAGGLVAASTTLLASGTPVALALADLNGDAYLDAAVAIEGSNVVEVFHNGGSGFSLKAVTFPLAGAPADLVAGDFDGDGDDDLAVAVTGSGSIAFFEQTSPGSLDAASWTAVPTAGQPHALAVGDFDGAGGIDLVAAVGDSVVAWVTTGAAASPLDELGSQVFSDGVTGGHAVLDVACGRFTGGARDDVVAVTTFVPESVRVMAVDPSTGPSLVDTVALGSGLGGLPILLEACDLDGADQDDLVIARDDGVVEALRFGPVGSAPTYVAPSGIPSTPVTDLASGLLNSDDAATFDDLVLGLGATSTGSAVEAFAVWLNNGAGCW